jgi:glutamate-5-semialdehyde dehydrogenase
MDLGNQILQLGQRARAAARLLARLGSDQKNAGLRAMADALTQPERRAVILESNAADVEAARANGLSSAMIDRLRLDAKRLDGMAEGIRAVAALPDPVGETLKRWTRPNGIEISKVRVPIGVVGIIYESRPNVTSDAAVLCTKTGNATILRGGSESIRSNVAIADALRAGAAEAGLPADSILLVSSTDREAVRHLCAMDKYLDVIVPRGGKGLIETVVSHARMPVIKHYDGICILYADKDADLEMARRIVLNGKCQRPGVCNAVETVLVHREIAPAFFATTGKALLEAGVELRCDATARQAVPDDLLGAHSAKIKDATPEDFQTEFLDLILAVRVVDSVEAAVDHIELNGSHHSDGIITANAETAEQFLNEVDSATVYWNASTRFTDGGEFGFGAEIGISTDKLHARGPMALEELTTYKYTIRGTGQIRE